MKMLKHCMMLVVILCNVAFLTSCDKTELFFHGNVRVTPSMAKEGDEVTFTMSKSDITHNGENVVKSVVFYIDGNEIGESSDENSNYAVKYKVMGLIAGDHAVTAHCKPKKNVKINVSISPATLTIEE